MSKLLVCLIIAAFVATIVPSAAAGKPVQVKSSANKPANVGKARVAVKANKATSAEPKKAQQSKKRAKSTRPTRTGGASTGRVVIKGGKTGKVLNVGGVRLTVPPGLTVEGYGDRSLLKVQNPKRSMGTHRSKSH